MGITAAQPRRGPSQSVPPAPNGTSQYPIQSTPKFQQSKNQTAAGVTKLPTVTGTDSSSNQRAIPVSEVYFDMIQDDEDEPDDDDSDDYEDTEYDYRDEDVQYPKRAQPPACSSSVVHDTTTGAIFHIVDNPVYCNDLPRPKVGPLTPLEIAEYQRCGIDLRRPKPQPLPSIPIAPPRSNKHCAGRQRKFKCKSFITFDPDVRSASPVRRRRSCSRPPRACTDVVPDRRPVPLVRKSAHECLTAYEIDYARKIFNRMCSPNDSKISFSSFLKLCRRMAPRLTQQRGFEHRAAYHFRLTDTDCDGRIGFEEFLFAYVQAREAERCSSFGALDTGCSMNERPASSNTPRIYSSRTSPVVPPPRRRKTRCVPVPITNHRPDYLCDLDRRSVPLRDIAERINQIYDI